MGLMLRRKLQRTPTVRVAIPAVSEAIRTTLLIGLSGIELERRHVRLKRRNLLEEGCRGERKLSKQVGERVDDGSNKLFIRGVSRFLPSVVVTLPFLSLFYWKMMHHLERAETKFVLKANSEIQ
ncbi:hypothetical protein TNCV_4437261 [Trichonephila clavipes]|nr:hypothetical protein TNCV_4437261 [Trichonephila clavipes]